MYDNIMSGRKSVDLEDLMKMGDDAAAIAEDNQKIWVNSDSELQQEVGKFDETFYKQNPERHAES